MDGVKLSFSDKALKAVASQALKRNAGARGLRAILENAMLDIMYEVPSSRVKEVMVNEEVILKNEKPLMVYEKEEKLA